VSKEGANKKTENLKLAQTSAEQCARVMLESVGVASHSISKLYTCRFNRSMAVIAATV
jgi:hypothetical protein